MSTGIKSATNYSAIMGKLLQQKRTATGMSQSDVANALGLTQGAWSRIENGSSVMSVDQLHAVSMLLGESPSSIVSLADQAQIELESQGVKIEMAKSGAHGAAMITGAALGALLAAILLRKA